jgi:hypothetical protein
VGIAIFDATSLAKKNKATHGELSSRSADLRVRCDTEAKAQERARRACQEKALVPFAEIFARIRNLDVAELESFDKLPSGAPRDPEVQRVRLSATGAVGALVGGAATGAAVGAVTFAAVGELAIASTGTAIAGLSGAAATNATLAWLGGGSLAAGGGGIAAGTTVLTWLVAAPVILALAGFVEWKGRQQRRQQQETAALMKKAAADLKLAETKASAVISRGQQIRGVLRKLRRELEDRLLALELLVAENDDYATYNPQQRRQVAESATIAITLMTVMRAPLVDDKGQVTDLSDNVVKDAKLRLATLEPA